MSDGFALDFTTVWDDDPVGAAFTADSMAEHAAENALEWEARENARIEEEVRIADAG